MTDTLIQNARLVLTMDANRRTIPSGDLLLRDGVIAAVGVGLPAQDCQVINAEGCLVTPGLVNTHHHLYQTMTRAVPAAQDVGLFGWLQTLYPIWAAMLPDDFFYICTGWDGGAATVGLHYDFRSSVSVPQRHTA